MSSQNAYDLKERDFLMIKEQIAMLIKLRQKMRIRESQISNLSTEEFEVNKILKMKYKDYLNLSKIISQKMSNVHSDYFEATSELLRKKAQFILDKYQELNPNYYKEIKTVYWKKMKATFKNLVTLVKKKRYTVKDFLLKKSKNEKNLSGNNVEEINRVLFEGSNLSNLPEEKIHFIVELIKKNLPQFTAKEKEVILENIQILEQIFGEMKDIQKRATIVDNLQKEVLIARPSMIKTQNTLEMFRKNFIFKKTKKHEKIKKRNLDKNRLKSMMIKRTPNMLDIEENDINVFDDYGELLMKIDKGKDEFKKMKRKGFVKSQDIQSKKLDNQSIEKYIKKMQDLSSNKKSLYLKKSFENKKSFFKKNIENEFYFELENGERKNAYTQRMTNFKKKRMTVIEKDDKNDKTTRFSKQAELNAISREMNHKRNSKTSFIRSFLKKINHDDEDEDIDLIDVIKYKEQLKREKSSRSNLGVIKEEENLTKKDSLFAILENDPSKKSLLNLSRYENELNQDNQTKEIILKSFEDNNKIPESESDSTNVSKRQIEINLNRPNMIRDKLIANSQNKNLCDQIQDYLYYLNLEQLQNIGSLFSDYQNNKIIKEIFISKEKEIAKAKINNLLEKKTGFEEFPSLITLSKESKDERPSFFLQHEKKKLLVLKQDLHNDCYSFFCKVKGYSNVCPLGFNNSKIIENNQLEDIQTFGKSKSKSKNKSKLFFLKSDLRSNREIKEKIAHLEREKSIPIHNESTNPIKDIDLGILNNIVKRKTNQFDNESEKSNKKKSISKRISENKIIKPSKNNIENNINNKKAEEISKKDKNQEINNQRKKSISNREDKSDKSSPKRKISSSRDIKGSNKKLSFTQKISNNRLSLNKNIEKNQLQISWFENEKSSNRDVIMPNNIKGFFEKKENSKSDSISVKNSKGEFEEKKFIKRNTTPIKMKEDDFYGNFKKNNELTPKRSLHLTSSKQYIKSSITNNKNSVYEKNKSFKDKKVSINQIENKKIAQDINLHKKKSESKTPGKEEKDETKRVSKQSEMNKISNFSKKEILHGKLNAKYLEENSDRFLSFKNSPAISKVDEVPYILNKKKSLKKTEERYREIEKAKKKISEFEKNRESLNTNKNKKSSKKRIPSILKKTGSKNFIEKRVSIKDSYDLNSKKYIFEESNNKKNDDSRNSLKRIPSEIEKKFIKKNDSKRDSIPEEDKDILDFLEDSIKNNSITKTKNNTITNKTIKSTQNEIGADSLGFSYDFDGSGTIVLKEESSNSNIKKNSKQFEKHIQDTYKNIMSKKSIKSKNSTLLQKEIKKNEMNKGKKKETEIFSSSSKVKLKNPIKSKVSLKMSNRHTLLTKNEEIIADDILSSNETKFYNMKSSVNNIESKKFSINNPIDIDNSDNTETYNIFDNDDLPIERNKVKSENIKIVEYKENESDSIKNENLDEYEDYFDDL